MSQVQAHVEELVTAIFNNRKELELKAAHQEVIAAEADHARRGLSQSGTNILSVTRIFNAAVTRAVDNTLEQLASEFRQAGRRDATAFWNFVEPKLKMLATEFQKIASSSALSKLRGQNAGVVSRVLAQPTHTDAQIRNRIAELLTRPEVS